MLRSKTMLAQHSSSADGVFYQHSVARMAKGMTDHHGAAIEFPCAQGRILTR